MNHPSHLYTRTHSERYIFTSLGKQTIEKAVEFTATSVEDLYNIGFGDLLPDGAIDDMAVSNNGDIVKVMSTVAQVLRAFTTEFPEAKIIFIGSTIERMKLYWRILRIHHEIINSEFIITSMIFTEKGYAEVPFDPTTIIDYHAFFVKRIL